MAGRSQKRVKEVCIDLKATYLHAIKESLPHTLIVADHFHVVKEMNRQVDELRKILQMGGTSSTRRTNKMLLLKGKENLTEEEKVELKKMFSVRKYEALTHAYFVKEKVREMYRSKSKKEAERKLDMLLSQLEFYEVGKVAEMRNTLLRWKPYILNFFESGTTNSFLEGCHNKMKLIKRLSYGFRNLENYILRLTIAFAPLLFMSHFHTLS